MRTFKFLAVITLTMLFHWSYAQPGSNDPSFNTVDLGLYNGDGFNGIVNTLSQQIDGKLIVGGQYSMFNGVQSRGIVRINEDGTIDNTFNGGGGVGGNAIYASGIQGDGKILVGGAFTTYDGVSRVRIARIHADGSLDNSFDPGAGAAGASNQVRALGIQPDGKIIIAGSFTSYDGVPRNGIARVNTDGTIDLSFDPGTGADNSIIAMSLQSDGKIIIVGGFTSFNGTTMGRVARLNSDGSLDNTFIPGIGANNSLLACAIQSDGKILIGGSFSSFDGTTRNRIARLNQDGSHDLTFNPGTGANNFIRTISVQADGKVVIGGSFTFFNGVSRNRIARLHIDGTHDLAFNPGTGVEDHVFTSFAKLNGKIIIGGRFISFDNNARSGIAQMNDDGSLDQNTFVPGSGANNSIHDICIQPDGKILIGGAFSSINGTLSSGIARLNEDGTVDASFNSGTGISGIVVNTYISTISLQNDGKIIIGGVFTSYNNISRRYIARINQNGSLDLTFNPGTGAPFGVFSSVTQPDGKIIIAGAFTTYNAATANRIVRLNADGSVDPGFQTGLGASGNIHSLSLQSDGKVIIGGAFTSYDGTPVSRIARLNSDGSLDGTFSIGSGFNSTVYSTLIQPDGKILVGGQFSNFNGNSRLRIARLNTDGTLDISFTPGTGASNTVHKVSLQADGKVIIAGRFTSYNGHPASHIARLNSDGTFDNGFVTGTGADNFVLASAIRPDGKILIGGDFLEYDGTPRTRMARLHGDPNMNITITYIKSNHNGYGVTCHGASDGSIDLTIDGGTPPYTFNWNNGNYVTQNLADISAGTYLVVVTDANNSTAEATVVISEPESISVSIWSMWNELYSYEFPVDIWCKGESSGWISASAFGGVSPYTYNWNNGAYITNEINNLGPGIYSLVVTDDNNCTATATYTVTEPEVALELNVSNDTFVFIGGPSGSECVTLKAAGTGGISQTGEHWYTWSASFWTSQTFYDTSSEITFCPVTAGDVNFTVVVSDGLCQVSKNILVKVYDASCGNNNDKIKVCINGTQTVCLTQNAANNVLANNPNAQLGSCEAYKTQMPGATVGMDVSIAPNPSSGRFTVQYNDGKERAFAVRVFDITGRVVYHAMQPGSALNMDIDLSAQAEGTYLVVVADGAVVLERTKVVLMGSR